MRPATGIGGCILFLLACGGEPWWGRQAPGAQLVLEYAQAWGVAWPPAWCQPLDGSQTACLRMMPDGSQSVLHWNPWRHPYEVSRAWGGLSPTAGIDLRDSIRRALEGRGAYLLRQMTWPDDTVHHFHSVMLQWCLDSARVTLARSWQDGYRLENVNMLVSAIPRAGCSR